MNVIVDFVIIPVGVGVSLSSYIAKCVEIIEKSGLNFELHANGTNIEGEWERVFATVKACHNELHKMGSPRVHSEIRVGTRIDKIQSMQDKLDRVAEKKADL